MPRSAVIAVALAKQNRRRRVAVGHGLDEHTPLNQKPPARRIPYMDTPKMTQAKTGGNLPKTRRARRKLRVKYNTVHISA
jgi:hypothetical protein